LPRQTLNFAAGIIRRHRISTGPLRRKLNPGQQALLVLACLRKGETFASLDLVPLPQRDRDDLLRLLATPVPDPIPIPWRNGIGGRLAAFAASAMRVMATGLNRVAKRLDP
jgi:hypothetical protein